MKNIIVRSLSGSVYVALIVCSILFGSEIGAFPLLMAVFAAIGIFELQKMTLDDFYASPRILLVDILIGISLPMVIGLLEIDYPLGSVIASLLFFVVCLLVIMRFVMELYSRRDNPVRHIAVSVFSIVYVSLPLMLAAVMSQVMSYLLLLMFVMIWLNDTGAFLVGSAIGSHRLFERLSPKKSWEGFVGGLSFSIASGYAAAALFPGAVYPFSANQLGLMGAVVSLMATWGDLFESMLKRHAGVKDSGSILPGHGGILDRIDSLLFVVPAILMLLAILNMLNTNMLIKGL